MIPEFIGRLPVFTSVVALDREAREGPQRAAQCTYQKQYQRLFELDGVELEFKQDALDAIADQALLPWGPVPADCARSSKRFC